MRTPFRHIAGVVIAAGTAFLLSQCSKVTETISGDAPDYLELTPQNIETELAVINLDVNQVAFDDMMMNYTEDVKIKADLFLYRGKAAVIADEEIKLKIKGSHSAQFPLKSLGVIFDVTFDNSDSRLIAPLSILPFHNLDSVRALRLRNSGNDFHETMIKDMVYSQLAVDAGLDIDLAYGEQVVVFVNNQFHGLMNLRTECNTNGISGLHHVPEEQVNLLKIENPNQLHYKSGNIPRLEEYVNAIANNDITYLLANTDLSNFIDYIIFQSFIANSDWPYNNVRLYSINNGPFRFVMYDLDWCNTLSLEKDPLYFIDPEKENIITDLFLLFYAQPDFKEEYEARYAEIIALPELSPQHFNSIVDHYVGQMQVEMNYQVEKYSSPATLLDWYREIDILKMHYAKRFDHFR